MLETTNTSTSKLITLNIEKEEYAEVKRLEF